MKDLLFGQGVALRTPPVRRLRSACAMGLVLMFIAGCASPVSLREMDAAQAKCATNGGVRWLQAKEFFGLRDVSAWCANGMSGYIEVKSEQQ